MQMVPLHDGCSQAERNSLNVKRFVIEIQEVEILSEDGKII